MTHYRASWVGNQGRWELPAYPLREGKIIWNKETLRERTVAPWKKLEGQGFGVMVGEFGAFNQTPHPVVLHWMRDCLDLWKEAGWGWALWNLEGPFGFLDSRRTDAPYENWRGHKLDRAMLDLLRAG